MRMFGLPAFFVGKFLHARMSVHLSVIVTASLFAVEHFDSTSVSDFFAINAAYLAALFLHEIFHTIVIQRAGFGAEEVLLLPYGGMWFEPFRLTEGKKTLLSLPWKRRELDTKTRQSEMLYAISGIVGSLLSGILLIGLSSFFSSQGEGIHGLLPRWIYYTGWCSLGLGLFNCIPLPPLDGGRLAEEYMLKNAAPDSRRRFIRYGQYALLAIAVLGLFQDEFALIPLLATLLNNSFRSSLEATTCEALKGLPVSQIMRDVTTLDLLNRTTSLKEALVVALRSFQDEFPVVEKGEVLGVVYRDDLLTARTQEARDVFLSDLLSQEYLSVTASEAISEVVLRLQGDLRTPLLVMEGSALKGMVLSQKLYRVAAIDKLSSDAFDADEHSSEL